MDYLYKNINGREIYLTFLEPIKNIYEKAPVYFLIPGGGWHYATRQSMIECSDISVEQLRKKGFAVVSIDYRTYNDDKVLMRDIIDDCYDVLRYVSNNHNELGVDRKRIVLSGHSAGGHLALMLAYTAKTLIPEVHILCAAVMSAPTVLSFKNNLPRTHFLDTIDDIFESEEQKEKFSPYNYVSRDCPPTFLSAGTSDWLVFSNSSELLYDKLKENNVKCELVLSVCGGHCFEKVHKLIEPNKGMDDIQEDIANFVLKYI